MPKHESPMGKPGSADYSSDHHQPMPFAYGVDPQNEMQALAYVAKFNAGLADVQAGLLASGLRPGMVGSDSEGYEVEAPGLGDAAAPKS